MVIKVAFHRIYGISKDTNDISPYVVYSTEGKCILRRGKEDIFTLNIGDHPDIQKISAVMQKKFIDDTVASLMLSRYAGILSAKVMSKARKEFIATCLKNEKEELESNDPDLHKAFYKSMREINDKLFSVSDNIVTSIHKDYSNYSKKNIFNLWGWIK